MALVRLNEKEKLYICKFYSNNSWSAKLNITYENKKDGKNNFKTYFTDKYCLIDSALTCL